MGSTTWPNSGNPLTIRYNYSQALQWYLETPIVDDEAAPSETKSKSIPGHQRRKGPSDNAPINVSQSTAEYLKDPSLKSGNARPGKSFILKTTPDSDRIEQRQFTYTGRAIDLIQILEADIKYPTYLYLSNGGRHTLNPVIGEA